MLWRAGGAESAGAAMLPADGSLDVLLRGEELLLIGPSTRAFLTTAAPGGRVAGLRLPVGSAAALLGVEPGRLRDGAAPLAEALPGAGRARLAGWRSVLAGYAETGRARAPEALLAEPDPGRLRWASQLQRLARGGRSAPAAARALGVSERQLRREMAAQFGYGYQALLRIERAAAARTLLASGLAPGEVAARAGYADQPHLTREFGRLVGVTPAVFAAGAAAGRA